MQLSNKVKAAIGMGIVLFIILVVYTVIILFYSMYNKNKLTVDTTKNSVDLSVVQIQNKLAAANTLIDNYKISLAEQEQKILALTEIQTLFYKILDKVGKPNTSDDVLYNDVLNMIAAAKTATAAALDPDSIALLESIIKSLSSGNDVPAADIKSQLTFIKSALDKLLTEKNQLVALIGSMESSIYGINSGLDTTKTIFDRLSALSEKIKNDMAAAANTSAALRLEINQKTLKINELQAAIDAAAAATATTQAQLDALLTAKQQALDAKAALEASYAALNTKYNQLNLNKQAVDADKAKLTADLTTCSAELTKSADSLSAANIKIAALTAQLASTFIKVDGNSGIVPGSDYCGFNYNKVLPTDWKGASCVVSYDADNNIVPCNQLGSRYAVCTRNDAVPFDKYVQLGKTVLQPYISIAKKYFQTFPDRSLFACTKDGVTKLYINTNSTLYIVPPTELYVTAALKAMTPAIISLNDCYSPALLNPPNYTKAMFINDTPAAKFAEIGSLLGFVQNSVYRQTATSAVTYMYANGFLILINSQNIVLNGYLYKSAADIITLGTAVPNANLLTDMPLDYKYPAKSMWPFSRPRMLFKLNTSAGALSTMYVYDGILNVFYNIPLTGNLVIWYGVLGSTYLPEDVYSTTDLNATTMAQLNTTYPISTTKYDYNSVVSDPYANVKQMVSNFGTTDGWHVITNTSGVATDQYVYSKNGILSPAITFAAPFPYKLQQAVSAFYVATYPATKTVLAQPYPIEGFYSNKNAFTKNNIKFLI